MEFLKRHYEKVLLSLVLLGLATVAAMLPLKIRKEREELESKRKGFVKLSICELQPMVELQALFQLCTAIVIA